MLPNSRELVVVEGSSSTNGHTPAGEFLADLAARMDMTSWGVKQRLNRLGIEPQYRDGRPWLSAEQVRLVESVPKGHRLSAVAPDAEAARNDRPAPPVVKVTRETVEIAEPTPKGETRTLTLASGGRITLTVDAAWLALSRAERELVYGLVDMLDGYEGGGP